MLDDFSKLLALPNVATTLSDVVANASYLSGQLERRGFRTKLLSAAPGTPPSLFAERISPGAKRTVLFYAHYDGQPVNQTGWLSPPFQPTLRTPPPESRPAVPPATGPLNADWRLYARGAGDDKGSIQAMISALGC